jgi:Tol biopolymer transport system component
MARKTCLRCDWEGDTGEHACPKCAARPLYVVDAARPEGPRGWGTEPLAVRSRDEGAGRPEPIRTPPRPPDPAALPTGEEPTKRPLVRVAALLVSALVGAFLLRSVGDEPREPPRASGFGASVTPVIAGAPLLPRDPLNKDATEISPAQVDHEVDLDTGQIAALPRGILRSIGGPTRGPSFGSGYAASPGGLRLAYVGTDARGRPQIFVAGRSAGSSPGIAGRGVRQVTHDRIGATQPAWSPDGSTIAYEGYGRGDVRNLFTLEVATGRSLRVTHEPFDLCECGLQFTPDGSSLLYTGGSTLHAEIRTVPVEGGRSTTLIAPETGPIQGPLSSASNGSLSPDGSLVTFVGDESGRGPARFLADADGADRRPIPGFASNPAGTWSPDGSRIVCWRGPSARGDRGGSSGVILVVDVATGHAFRVARGVGAIWLNDHTLLVDV